VTIRTKVCGAAVLLGALAVVPLAAAGGAGDRDLRFRATQTQFVALDNGAPGSSLGDVTVYADEFTDAAGRSVGRDGGTCTTTTMLDSGAFSADCLATLVLERGEITVHGEVTFASPTDLPPFTTAITGGTGAYQGASGELRGEPLNATDYRYTVDFARR
jgi:Allene oxide cyclase barrel like domain